MAHAAVVDVVFATADCDDLPAAQAILQGAKDRYEKTGKAPILIHISGTGEVRDNAQGLHSTDVVYSDLDIPLFEALPPSQPHRKVDLAVIAANNEGCMKTYLVLPLLSTEYEASIARKQGGVVGEGKNHWPNVDVNEMADLYLIIFNLALSSSSAPAKYQHSEEHQLYDVSKAVAVGLLAEVSDLPSPHLSARRNRNLYYMLLAPAHHSTMRKAEAKPWDGN